jgi:hypothetical protein
VAGQHASPDHYHGELDEQDAEHEADYEAADEYDGEPDDDSAFDSMLSSSDDRDQERGRRRRRRPMWGGWALLGVLVLLLAGGGVWLHDLVTRPPVKAAPAAPSFQILMLNVTSGDSVPTAPAPIPASVPGPHDPQAAWIAQISTETYIPSRALSAYVTAQTLLAQRYPACGMTWTMLAGIGWVESHHGQFEGDEIGPDNRELRPIIGPALNGTDGMQRIPDTGDAALDGGDTQWAHALGPMQFLPTTWHTWGLRASGDGKAPDPQNMADAALTAGHYLCNSGDLTQPGNWWKAVFVYNNSQFYGVQVYSAAQAYSDATRPAR